MQAAKSFVQAFLKQMLLGIQLSAVSHRSGSLQERKSAIKLSADVAMAVARGSKKWTRGLIASLSKEEQNRSFRQFVLGKDFGRPAKLCHSSWKIPRSKNIVRRSLRFLSKRKSNIRAPNSSVLAGTLVEKRTQVLKRLVPGGESMDGFSLLDETLDYVTCLQAQVDVMQKLMTTLEASKHRADSNAQCPKAKLHLLAMVGSCYSTRKGLWKRLSKRPKLIL
ncbi:hypothetical protein MUK42_24096 [Musa troglodytarum]|uniref:IBH1-like N-terminal domain-containing protein n=1 Tax=Musa troglodytarum TaxID=320322 RepID=A0A9E7ECL6_9LILI|nr:hypothetical protein MUK42_24096 [Musa troglodytarum]